MLLKTLYLAFDKLKLFCIQTGTKFVECIEFLVMLIYPNTKLQVAERRQKILFVRSATCNVI